MHFNESRQASHSFNSALNPGKYVQISDRIVQYTDNNIIKSIIVIVLLLLSLRIIARIQGLIVVWPNHWRRLELASFQVKGKV